MSIQSFIFEDFTSGPLPLSRRSLHKPLELNRTMLPSEVNIALPHSLIPRELRILPDPPAGITSQ